jgi:hypothetical protein
MTDTSTAAVELFIAVHIKDHVLSEGQLRTAIDTRDAYAIADLLRALVRERDSLLAEQRSAA